MITFNIGFVQEFLQGDWPGNYASIKKKKYNYILTKKK